jgi:hypothetical protein
MPARGDCEYGERVCDCPNDTQQWSCWNPADCPDSAPAELAACDTVGMECGYGGGLDCECTAIGWDCGRQVCPETQPTAGGECSGGDGTCAYADNTCDCGNDDTWLCWSPADCPSSQPAPESECTLVGISCEYANGACECDQNGWDCEGQYCPEAAPTAGENCEGGAGRCSYGTDASASECDCERGNWVCWSPGDCPASEPAAGGDCSVAGMICAYDATECECDDMDGWECDEGP